MSKLKLKRCIELVNKRFLAGLNDDDQVARMVEEDAKTIDWSHYPLWDTYELVTSQEKLRRYVERFGEDSKEVEEFKNLKGL